MEYELTLTRYEYPFENEREFYTSLGFCFHDYGKRGWAKYSHSTVELNSIEEINLFIDKLKIFDKEINCKNWENEIDEDNYKFKGLIFEGNNCIEIFNGYRG